MQRIENQSNTENSKIGLILLVGGLHFIIEISREIGLRVNDRESLLPFWGQLTLQFLSHRFASQQFSNS